MVKTCTQIDVSISTLLHCSLFQYKSGDTMDDNPAPSIRLLTDWGIQAIPYLLPFFIWRNVLWCLIHVLILSSLKCCKWLIVFCAIKTYWSFLLDVLLPVYRGNLLLLLLKKLPGRSSETLMQWMYMQATFFSNLLNGTVTVAVALVHVTFPVFTSTSYWTDLLCTAVRLTSSNPDLKWRHVRQTMWTSTVWGF